MAAWRGVQADKKEGRRVRKASVNTWRWANIKRGRVSGEEKKQRKERYILSWLIDAHKREEAGLQKQTSEFVGKQPKKPDG